MTADEFRRLVSDHYGQRGLAAFSRDFGVNSRTPERWARDGIQKDATSESVRRFFEERRRARIPPPAPDLDGDDRDDACRDALDPQLAALSAAAEGAGWHPAEVAAAMLGHAVDAMRAGAGSPAALSTLRSVIDGIKAEITRT